MTPPICNDCRYYLKVSPGFCKRIALVDGSNYQAIRWLAHLSRLPNRWRITEQRIMGRCGRDARCFEKARHV